MSASPALAIQPLLSEPERARELPLAFNAASSEYFRIWIVNLFFSVITLGIYSAWAKVRKKRYFYGMTMLDGATFDYLANPIAILKGRLAAFALFVLYAFTTEVYPWALAVFAVLFLLMLPWLVVRASIFNARNSAYRGLRFDFVGSVKDAAKLFIGFALLMPLTFGLIYPMFVARQKRFIARHHAYGDSQFDCELESSNFYSIYLRAFLIVLALSLLVAGAVGAMFAANSDGTASWIMGIAPLFGIYFAYLIAFAYLQARVGNLVWNNLRLPGVQFTSNLQAIEMIKLYLSNTAAILLSAGLLIPWATVRMARYRLERLTVTARTDSDRFTASRGQSGSAAGQEMGDLFNIDFGL
ncbi:MAG: YjgN family protein [Burkholderiales bacterium]